MSRSALATSLRRHFAGRIDPLTSAILVFPLFATYQIGILIGARGRNGVDFVTSGLIELCRRDLGTYLQLLAGLLIGYGLLLLWLGRTGRFKLRAFLPMLGEATVYAFFMGALINGVIRQFVDIMPMLSLTPLLNVADFGARDVLVLSAGAGLHEELVFRVLLMGGLVRLFALPNMPLGRVAGALWALVISSLIFSLVHHVGPSGEVFTSFAFIYRTLAGLIFGTLFWLRGFAVAAWTHAIYDVFVLALPA